MADPVFGKTLQSVIDSLPEGMEWLEVGTVSTVLYATHMEAFNAATGRVWGNFMRKSSAHNVAHMLQYGRTFYDPTRECFSCGMPRDIQELNDG